jgi:hypothetical protein
MDSMAVRFQFSVVGESLRLVWATLSLIVLAVLLSPFLVGRDRLTGLTPMCERKARYGLECPFCGMTTCFLDISEARFKDASRANRAGIPLYLVFLSNEICALAFLRRKRAVQCK